VKTEDILLRLIALESVIGELCDLARRKGNERQAARELLRLEARMVGVIHEIEELLAPA
jgi:hypothetical protein